MLRVLVPGSIVLAIANACTAFSDAEVPVDAASGAGGKEAGVGGGGAFPGGGGGGNAGATGGASGASGGGGGGSVACTGCGTSECECSPAAPTGWNHVRIVETLDGSAPVCPAGYTKSTIAIGEGAKDTGCGACECGAFDPSSAGPCDQIWQWSGLCNGPPVAKSPAAPGQCVQMTGTFVKMGSSSGTCPASAPPNPPAFSKTVTLCEPASFGSGCGADACIPLAKPPYEAARCVVSQVDGDLACPSGFPVKRSYNTTFSDARTCTGCSCTLSSVTCSGGTAKWCTDGSCNNCPYATVLPGNCTSTDGYQFEIFSGSATATGGSCTPSGAATSGGSVSATGTRIVCCS